MDPFPMLITIKMYGRENGQLRFVSSAITNCRQRSTVCVNAVLDSGYGVADLYTHRTAFIDRK